MNSKLLTLVVVLVAVLTSPTWAKPPAPVVLPAGVTTIDLSSTVSDSAMNPETGALATIDSSEDTITLYPRAFLDGHDKNVVGPISIGRNPTSIVFKTWKNKRYFVVACTKDNSICVLEATTLEKVKTLSLGRDQVSCVATATNSTDPYVYYAFGTGHDGRAARINIDGFADEGAIIPGLTVKDLAVSPDGRRIYTRGPWSPTGFGGYQHWIDRKTGKDTWSQFHYEHITVGPYLVDPLGRYVATGEHLYSVDLEATICELDFTPAGFFRDRPVIFGLRGNYLIAASSENFKTLGVAPLTPDPKAPNHPALLREYPKHCLADSLGNRIILARARQLILIPLSVLGIGEEKPRPPAPLPGNQIKST
jgi:hypothetical protein